MKRAISTPNSDSVPEILSQAIDTGPLVFVSGQININPAGEMIGESVEEKLSQIMKNAEAILSAANLTLDHIVKATILVTDLAQMPEINQFYPTYFTAPYPAREAIGVNQLPLGATIEISFIASR